MIQWYPVIVIVIVSCVEKVKTHLTRYERNRMLWIWHDHSSLVSHGIIALMVDVLYDPIVFSSKSESPGIQEYVEEGEIHIVAHGSSSLSDQASIIPERLAELDGLCEAVTMKNGIQITDILKLLKEISQQPNLKQAYLVVDTFHVSVLLLVFQILPI